MTSALAGTVLWDGRFNQKTIDDLDEWSWSNQVGQYQYYIVSLLEIEDEARRRLTQDSMATPTYHHTLTLTPATRTLPTQAVPQESRLR